MWKTQHQLNQSKRFPKKSQLNQLKGRTNGLNVKERDYMIQKAQKLLHISDDWLGSVKAAANYLSGPRFWELVEISQSKRKPANYFIFCINKELGL